MVRHKNLNFSITNFSFLLQFDLETKEFRAIRFVVNDSISGANTTETGFNYYNGK